MGFIKKTFSQFVQNKPVESQQKSNDILAPLDEIRKMQSSVQQGLFDTQMYYEKARQMANEFGLSGKNVKFLNKVPEFLGKISQHNSMIQTRLGYIRTTERELKNFIGKIKGAQKEKLEKSHGSFYNLVDPNNTKSKEDLKYDQNLGHDPLLSPPEHVPDDSEGNITVWEDKTNRKGDKIFKSWQSNGKPVWHSTIEQPFYKRDTDLIRKHRQDVGSMPFFIEKLHGRTIDNKTYKVNPMDLKKTALDYPNRMVFPAFLDTFDDSYSTEWSDYSFIGRSDSVYIYNKTQRTISLTFYLISDFSADIFQAATEEINQFYEKKNAKVDDQGRQTVSNIAPINNPNNITDPTLLEEFNKVAQEKVERAMEGDLTLDEQRTASFYMKSYIENFLNWGTGTANVPENLANGNFGFIPGTTGTPEQMWARATFLAQTCYPWYRKDGKMKEQPFIRLRLGDWFDVIAKVDNLSFAPEDFGWDFNVSPNIGNIPMGMKVTMSLTIIHQDAPTSDYARFYYRKDFDSNTSLTYVPDVLKQSLTKDQILDRLQQDSQAFAQLFREPKITDKNPGAFANVGDINDENSIPMVSAYAQKLETHADILKQFQVLNIPKKSLDMGEKLSKGVKSAASLLKTKQKLKNFFKHGDSELTQELNSLANAPLKIIKETNQITDFNIADKLPGLVDKLEVGESTIKGVSALSGITDKTKRNV